MIQEVLEPNEKISEHDLDSFAQRHAIRLPKAYEEFLRTTNGGQPVPAAFPIEGMADNPEGVVQAFFGLKARILTEDLDFVLEDLGDSVPRGILPIACTDGYDFLVLDLRQTRAPVLFWDRRPFWGHNVWNESDLYPVASSFESLLQALHDPPEWWLDL